MPNTGYTKEYLLERLKENKGLPVGDYLMFKELIENYFKILNELVQCNEVFQDSQIQIEAQHKAHNKENEKIKKY